MQTKTIQIEKKDATHRCYVNYCNHNVLFLKYVLCFIVLVIIILRGNEIRIKNKQKQNLNTIN